MTATFSFTTLHGETAVVLGLFLLVQPNVHYETMGDKFDHKHLDLNGQTVNGVVLLCFVKILQTGGYHILCFVKPVKVLYLRVVGLEGVVEEFGLDPAWIHGHDPDAPGLQLPVDAP